MRARTLTPWAFALVLSLLALITAAACARADALPDRVAPAPPFPPVLEETFEREFVAPGVWLGRYYVMTSSGPLVIHALAVNVQMPNVRVNTVLAGDHLISKGETVSSMAQRTQAVAGMNGDFFDIGNTYQPIGMLVRTGTLVRSPSGRAVLSIASDRTATFQSFHYSGTVADDDGRSWDLTGVNVWPPQAGASLVSGDLGLIPSEPGTELVPVVQVSDGRYQVTGILDAIAPQTATLAFAYGPAARRQNGVPAVGDMLTTTSQTDPPLGGIATAIGGGPLLVRGGALYDDPLPPAAAEALKAVPLSGALRQRDGTLLFVQVDGRAPQVSIGLTRSAFAALLLSFGAVDGMAFDGGGSSTLVARSPGDTLPSVQNAPSDGREREVSDGIFVYDDTPLGPPDHLVLRNFPRRMLHGAQATLDVQVSDAAGHVLGVPPTPLEVSVVPRTMAHVSGAFVVADDPSLSGTLHVESGALSTDEPLAVLDALATLRIEPEHPNPEPGKSIALHAAAFDASGAPIDVDGRVVWSAGAPIDSNGTYRAGARDGLVTAHVGDQQVQTLVRVGQHDVPIDVFRHDGPGAQGWTFASAPASQPGSVELDDDNALALAYDFTGSERVAYANASIQLGGEVLALSVDVQGDGSGDALRVAVTTADGDRLPITLAPHVDWQGWRRLTVRMPHEAVSPLTLDGFYLVASHDALSVPTQPGAIALRNLHGLFAGTSTPNPPYRFE
jgi:exopolysaccharide biosynthesis protein